MSVNHVSLFAGGGSPMERIIVPSVGIIRGDSGLIIYDRVIEIIARFVIDDLF